jgi:hypothetical protein
MIRRMRILTMANKTIKTETTKENRMKNFGIKIAFTTAIIATSLSAWGIDDDYGYKGISGQKYKYDLSDPVDRFDYKYDRDAQINDRYNYNQDVEFDRKMGDFGGGIKADDFNFKLKPVGIGY